MEWQWLDSARNGLEQLAERLQEAQEKTQEE
jgi:hypothetical protein